MFSVPRVVPAAARVGLAPGESYDIETGCDVRDPASVVELWRHIQQDRPYCVCLSPPCQKLSVLQQCTPIGFARARSPFSNDVLSAASR